MQWTATAPGCSGPVLTSCHEGCAGLAPLDANSKFVAPGSVHRRSYVLLRALDTEAPLSSWDGGSASPAKSLHSTRTHFIIDALEHVALAFFKVIGLG